MAHDQPEAMLVFREGTNGFRFTGEQVARLRRSCSVTDPRPVTTFDGATTRARLARTVVLITGWGAPPISADILDSAPRLQAIVHAAGSVRRLIGDACWDRGILVTSAASANAVPVAEFTLAAVLMSTKRIFRIRERFRVERRDRPWATEFPDVGNYGKILGVVGASRIGRLVIDFVRPFGLETVVFDPYLDARDAHELQVRRVGLDELFAASDIVSLHAPLQPATRSMVGDRQLSLLRDGATLINTARDGLVDQRALERELVSGRIDAIIDATQLADLPPGSPLFDLPNVFLTPHVAGSIGRETRRLTDLALDEVERFVRGEPLLHAVHRSDLERLA